MFLLMAAIMDRSGVARDLYDAISVWAGGLPGGVAVMTLVAAVFMAATTGIIGGEIILLGLVALPQMLRLGYHKYLAIGTICAGGSLGTMIPPSIVLIFYGLTAGVAIGVYNLLGGIRFIQDAMTGLPFEPLVIVLIMMAVLIVLGLFMDWVDILLLTMPIFVPIIENLGYGPVWFDTLFCMNMQISYLSPPSGPQPSI